MELKSEGWVIINIGHPRTGKSFIVDTSFFRKRSEAINYFITGSGSSWLYWKKKFNYRCVRATQEMRAQNI